MYDFIKSYTGTQYTFYTILQSFQILNREYDLKLAFNKLKFYNN